MGRSLNGEFGRMGREGKEFYTEETKAMSHRGVNLCAVWGTKGHCDWRYDRRWG